MIDEDNFGINFALFKLVGFYEMVDPGTEKLWNFNKYKLINVALLTFTTILTLFGLLGIFYGGGGDDEATDDVFKDIQMVFYLFCTVSGNFKIIAVMSKSGEFWKLFGSARGTFLRNAHSKSNKRDLTRCRDLFSRIFPWYFFLFFMAAFSWISMPNIINVSLSSSETAYRHVRKNNVINLKYPVSAETYNAFFRVFYVMESVMISYVAYGLLTFDLFFIAFLMLISTQYEMISAAYKNLNRNDTENSKGKICNNVRIGQEFRMITKDCQNIYKQLEIFYGASRPVILVQMVTDAMGMITMPYLIVLTCQQNGSVFNLNTLRFIITLSAAGLECYIYCKLYQLVNDKKENVNFGLYCSNWTDMSVQMKKLILHAMQMNNSNKLTMNWTPLKLVDLPLFASIVRSSYSITSVLINSKTDNS